MATAIIVMSLMLLTGVAILKIVNTQSKSSGTERVRESAFNLGEGFLYAQGAVLQTNWPKDPPAAGNPNGSGYVKSCSSTTIGTNPANQCPTLSELLGSTAAFNNVDIQRPGSNLKWTVEVRDDTGPVSNVYDETQVDHLCATNTCKTYDSNNNKKLWVRVDISIPGAREKARSLVALLQLENFALPFPTAAVAGGSVNFTNGGNKTVVETLGQTSVITRCVPNPSTTTQTAMGTTPATNSLTVTVADRTGFVGGRYYAIDTGNNYEVLKLSSLTAGSGLIGVLTFQLPGATKSHNAGVTIAQAPGTVNPDGTPNTCQNWDWNQNNPQVSPTSGYTSNPTFSNGLTQAQFDLLKKSQFTATYDNACPDNNVADSWKGKILIIHTPAAGCKMNPNGGGDINSASDYGFIVVQNGSLEFAANGDYYGVIYMRNEQNWGPAPDPVVFSITGNGTVYGGIAVDKFGRVVIGQSSGNEPSVVFDPNAFLTFGAAGAAGLVQNTWREL